MTRRRRLLGGCGVVLVLAAGSVAVVVQWVASHPGVIAFVVLLGALGGIGGTRATARQIDRRATRTNAEREFATLTPGEFEEAIADLCRRDGCTGVRVVGGAGDLAADVLATVPDGRRVLIQCKRHAPGNPVRSPEVQRVGGTYAIVHRADLAVIVTTSNYTADARAYARTAGISLVDGRKLASWAGGGQPPWN